MGIYKRLYGKKSDDLKEPLAGDEKGGDEVVETEEEYKASIEFVQSRRYTYLVLMLLAIAGYDLYLSMPFPFINGEVAAKGLSLSIAGVYIAIVGIVAFIIAPFAKDIMTFNSPSDMQLLGISLLALVSIPQGMANQLDASGFVSLLMVLRVLEGIVLGISETAIYGVIYFCFPPKEVANAIGIVVGIRGLMGAASAPIGAGLYSAGGFVFPYLLVGSLNVVTVVAIRAMLPKRVPVKEKSDESMRSLLRYPAFVGACKCRDKTNSPL